MANDSRPRASTNCPTLASYANRDRRLGRPHLPHVRVVRRTWRMFLRILLDQLFCLFCLFVCLFVVVRRCCNHNICIEIFWNMIIIRDIMRTHIHPLTSGNCRLCNVQLTGICFVIIVATALYYTNCWYYEEYEVCSSRRRPSWGVRHCHRSWMRWELKVSVAISCGYKLADFRAQRAYIGTL